MKLIEQKINILIFFYREEKNEGITELKEELEKSKESQSKLRQEVSISKYFIFCIIKIEF